MRSRSFRRAQREKYLKRWRRYFHQFDGMTEEEIEKQARIRTRTRQVCSCLSCGNKRKWYGATLQERKAEE